MELTSDDGLVSAAGDGVHRTIGRYVHFVDESDFARVSELFVADCEFVIEVFDKPARERLRGRAAIRERLARSAERRAADPSRDAVRRHHVSSVLVEVESEALATSTSYFIAMTRNGPDHWGRYSDRLRLDGSDWLFLSRYVLVEGRRVG
jgi:hypothetical protein